MQMGHSFIVYNPYNLSSLAAPPMHFTGTAVDAPTHQAGHMLGETANIQQSILVQEGMAQAGDTVYVTRCSTDGATCLTA